MSFEVAANDLEKMLKTCQAIIESCAKPFVWEEEGAYKYGNYKKPFNLVLPHPQLDKELSQLLEKFSGSPHLYDQIKATCTLDEEWSESGTYGLDRDFTCYFSKFTLKPEYAGQIKTYFLERLKDLQKDEKDEEINRL